MNESRYKPPEVLKQALTRLAELAGKTTAAATRQPAAVGR